ncbi:MAG TPA: NAD-dependent epimerase/dehydratase family protein [Dongiaceae bacterium]|jgi:UDP-glucuronate 4-epimerase
MILVTGAAGFIGFHVAQYLLARGEQVVGVDCLNTYYDVKLKEARLAQLQGRNGFSFHRFDLCDRAAAEAFFASHSGLTGIIHLAAQAGVRHSLIDPYSYIDANVTGHLAILEASRRLKALKHMVYASSSSVYGGNDKMPFSVADRVDQPVSIYAATKLADELMTTTYSHLFGLPATGLRFFTVYGPWGRPDMSAFLFTEAILAGKPIQVFNGGEMVRDFTYIDDIVTGVVAALDRPPVATSSERPHRVYNLGNHRAVGLMDFIATIEKACGRKAKIDFQPIQPGDVKATLSDIEATTRDLGYRPTIEIEVGVPNFVAWYRHYYGV